MSDLEAVRGLFESAIRLQGRNGYKVWQEVDIDSLRGDIEKGLQFKITASHAIICIFSIQYNDPLIWREKDQSDAIYLHRIVVSPAHKGQRLFQYVLAWATMLARRNSLKFVRMDTWAENRQLIRYYESFGFTWIEDYKTPDSLELPIQNRNLSLALLEMALTDNGLHSTE